MTFIHEARWELSTAQIIAFPRQANERVPQGPPLCLPVQARQFSFPANYSRDKDHLGSGQLPA